MRNSTYHCSMSQQGTLPTRKKKKRTLFEDDDFFVLKKTKKTKSPSKTVLPKKPSDSTKLVTSDSLNSDDLLQSFHSARDAFSSDELAEVETVAEKTTNSANRDNFDDDKNKLQRQLKDVQSIDLDDVEEVDDDPDTALSTFFKGISTQKEDSSRKYLVKVVSKVFGWEEEIEVGGDVTFENILREATLRRRLQLNPGLHSMMMWVEGRSELKPFFKPSTLRIPPTPYGAPSKVTVLHIFAEQLPELENMYAAYGENDENVYHEDIGNITSSDEIHDVVVLDDDSPNATITKPPNSEYFVIGLKGKDNKRIECEVGPNTKIRDLLLYYLKVKGMNEQNINAKLVFDDEVLDLDGKVGDTELEEDFEVQIHV